MQMSATLLKLRWINRFFFMVTGFNFSQKWICLSNSSTPFKWGNKKTAPVQMRFNGGVKYFLMLRYRANAVMVFLLQPCFLHEL